MKLNELETIYQGNQSTVFKGIDPKSNKHLIVKVLNSEFPNGDQIERFNNEFDVTRMLDIPGVRKVINKDKKDGKNCLILEYFGQQTLKEFISVSHDTCTLLRIACSIASTLGEIHQHNIIHKDINSNNILIDNRQEVRVIDFGLATKFTLKTRHFSHPEQLEGTLAYISPEQTGRMNRSVDYRSDLYSLGVVLYEMFTGQLPFREKDPLELIHSHIARNPVPPSEIETFAVLNPELRNVLSQIILKLLSKNAENRYQSAFGLKFDLETALALSASTECQGFKLASKDFSGRLIIPEKLYGRGKEIDLLYNLYANISDGEAHLLLVSGRPGVGKSALIHEIHKILAEKRGIYIEGKFDQYQKDIPYYAIIHAFTQLVNIILQENEEKMEYWRNLIQDSVGNIGEVLINLIPELELIIGKQSELTMLEGKEALNRFNYVWSNFVKAIATPEHPLVLFIDDLHRADNSSVELIRNLLSDNEIRYFLCIMAYRDSEINLADLQLLESVENIHITKIELENLNQGDVNRMLSDSLIHHKENGSGPSEELMKLACLISSKTLGNPFFTRQFLLNLYEEEYIVFDYQRHTWKWDFADIENQNITDNVVKLMSNKVSKLPEKTQQVLKIASCIGNLFDLKILSVIYHKNQDVTRSQLEPAVLENLIIPADAGNYRFTHDRIQQAVYDSIEESLRSKFHLQTGKLLLEHFNKEDLQKQIFEVVNQLNYGKELIHDRTEKQELAALNYQAAIMAKRSSAYLPAYNYLRNARDLLNKDSWDREYEFTLSVFDELVELSYLAHKYKKTESYTILIKHNAKNILDICNAHHALINSYRARLKYREAVETGLKLLGQLGHKIPMNPSKIYILKEFLKTQFAIVRKDPEFFEQLPLMTDKKRLAIVKIMDAVATCAYYGYPNLFPIMCFRPIRMSIKHGQTMEAPLVFIGYAIALTIIRRFDAAIKYARLGEKLIDKLGSNHQKAKILYILHYFVLIWKNKLHTIIPELVKVYKIGPEVGDFEFAGYAIMSTYLSIYCNYPLQKLQNIHLERSKLVKRFNQRYAINFFPFTLQVFENLLNPVDDPCLLKGKYFNEEDEIEQYVANEDRGNLIHFYSMKILLSLLFENFEHAEEYLMGSEKYKDALRGNYYFAVGDFLRSLIAVKLVQKTGEKKFLKVARKNQAQMKVWASHNPVNFEHKYYLVQAEISKVRGEEELAKEYYDRAIFGAKENDFYLDEALSRHFAGQFYTCIEKNHLAEYYLQGAYNCYKKWEAFGVCQYLDHAYPEYSLAQSSVSSLSTGTSSKSTGSTKTGVSALLDLTSIVKASHSLSGVVNLENLLKSILMIIMENAGAEYAVIIQNNEGRFTIEAKGRYGVDEMEVLHSEELRASTDMALNVVNYVIRTRKYLVTDNALEDTELSKNEYIQRKQVKSIFCYPIIHKSNLVAVLYLENNLTTHAFTSERIETINILSSQIAISIENALLYRNLEDKVKRRTLQLEQAKQKIEESHKHITDSITYASRIQNAILPTEQFFKENLRDYFIIFKPRDVVSGDFYWAKQVNEFFIFAVADCTGHGVPGAFVSMLGISFMNEIVRKREVKTAAQMLEQLRIQLKVSMRQTGESIETKDGMDIALCIFNTKSKELQFSGANNPLYLIRKKGLREHAELACYKKESGDGYELYEIKGDKQPIGVHWEETRFTNHTCHLLESDSLYIFSDGILDQFGGDRRKKYKSRNFKNLLLSIQNEPMGRQKELIEQSFLTWKGIQEQIDDVCILGIRG